MKNALTVIALFLTLGTIQASASSTLQFKATTPEGAVLLAHLNAMPPIAPLKSPNPTVVSDETYLRRIIRAAVVCGLISTAIKPGGLQYLIQEKVNDYAINEATPEFQRTIHTLCEVNKIPFRTVASDINRFLTPDDLECFKYIMVKWQNNQQQIKNQLLIDSFKPFIF